MNNKLNVRNNKQSGKLKQKKRMMNTKEKDYCFAWYNNLSKHCRT